MLPTERSWLGWCVVTFALLTHSDRARFQFNFILKSNQMKCPLSNKQVPVVYFDQWIDALNAVLWSKWTFWVFSHLFPLQTEKERKRMRKRWKIHKNGCTRVLVLLLKTGRHTKDGPLLRKLCLVLDIRTPITTGMYHDSRDSMYICHQFLRYFIPEQQWALDSGVPNYLG